VKHADHLLKKQKNEGVELTTLKEEEAKSLIKLN
jgi:hypothetical protein